MTNVGISFQNLCTIMESVQAMADDPNTNSVDESLNYICCSNKANAAMYCANTVTLANRFGMANVADIGTCDQDSTSTLCAT